MTSGSEITTAFVNAGNFRFPAIRIADIVASKKASDRHGVLLLVVLCLLVLFVLACLTFLTIAAQYRRSTLPMARETEFLSAPNKLLDVALRQLLRDTNDPNSALLRNSLLLDKYGRPGTRARIVRAYPCDGMIRFDASGLGDLALDSRDVQALDIVASEAPHSSFLRPPDTWMGGEVTSTSGAAAGLSTRILHYLPARTTVDGQPIDRIYTLPFSSTNGVQNLKAGDTLVINDAPFDGTGVGYTGKESLDRTVALDFGAIAELPLALILNRGFHVRKWEADGLSRVDELLNSGGLDEPYDAADFQNPFLACTITRADVETTGSDRKTILPSFHRPDLVNYLAARMGISLAGTVDSFSEEQRNVLRAAILRPLAFDHPRFNTDPTRPLTSHTGLGFDPVAGPWDVDNDGDGELDSVWLDLGMPVQSARDGRAFKPLFAFLIRDLDGRVNVNAAGNLGHRDAGLFFQPGEAGYPLARQVLVDGALVGLPRGMGYGPAEIHLGAVFPGSAAWDPIIELVASRYHARAGSAELQALPGRRGNDFSTYLRAPGIPNGYLFSGASNLPTEYLSPSDVYGRSVVWVAGDMRQPSYAPPGSIALGEAIDDSYEIDLLHRNSFDSPIADLELEPYLRRWDYDVRLHGWNSSRLSKFLGEPFARGALEFLATTSSFEVPVPPASPPIRDSQGVVPCGPIVDMFRARMAARGLSPDEVERQLDLLCPWELRRGEKFNVNRSWGNGLDNDIPGSPGYGIADDPGELAATGGSERIFAEVVVDAANDLGSSRIRWPSYVDGRTGEPPRMIFARHLFALAMFLKDQHALFPVVREDPPLTLETQRRITAQRLAQWAVNVVDFRDADMIMTGFEYDADPYDGWNVDGNLATIETTPERQVVWGCELPVLLLTESLAFHDRRAADTSEYGSRREDSDHDGSPDDDDLDQPRIPQGSLFLELYCPPSTAQNRPSADLFAPDGTLDLERRGPNGRPVWRIGISKPFQDLESEIAGYRDPEERMRSAPNTANFAPGSQELERYIWFIRSGPSSVNQTSRNTYFNRASNPARVGPGRYVVVGPRGRTVLGQKPGSPGDDLPSDQSLSLESNRHGWNGVVYRGLDGAAVSRSPATVVIAAANRPMHWSQEGPPIGLNISEPLIGNEYYDEPNARSASARAAGFFEKPKDRPLDSQTIAEDRPNGKVSRLGDWVRDNHSTTQPKPTMLRTGLHRYVDRNGYERRWRTAYLQRIADPTRDWHPQSNPYLTVDWISIDLTVFNGSTRQKELNIAGVTYSLDPDDALADPHPLAHSRERGITGAGRGENLLWTYESTPPESADDTLDPESDELFQYRIRQSIGGRNASFRAGRIAYFPWMQWNNRPFVSELELLLVPSSSPDRLCFEWETNADANPYLYYADNMPRTNFRALPFGHLLNFYQGDGQAANALCLWRCLDYLYVPSRFNGTTKTLSTHLADPTSQIVGQHGIDGFWSPFHQLSELRVPGKINLNTIFDRRVWNALMAGFPEHFHANPAELGYFDRFVLARQGYLDRTPGTVTPYGMDPEYPTVFANPFRPASLSGMLPRLASPARWPTGVQASLLREAHDRPGTPLLSRPLGDPAPPYRDPMREPQFHIQGIQRLSNLTTTQSNVYAIWITVGYFSVEPWRHEHPNGPIVVDPMHPQGHALGPEIGIEQGESSRHRGFFLVDRSIPVGFEIGVDLNVDSMVRLRRIIE